MNKYEKQRKLLSQLRNHNLYFSSRGVDVISDDLHRSEMSITSSVEWEASVNYQDVHTLTQQPLQGYTFIPLQGYFCCYVLETR